jgi:predicted permease
MTTLAAIALLFALGMYLRQRHSLAPRHGSALLRAVLNFGIPALIIGSVSRTPLDPALIRLPLVAAGIALTVGSLARAAAWHLQLSRPQAGALIVSAMCMNLAFVFPMVFAAWGNDALARTLIFDAGNAIMTWSVVYFIATRYGGRALRVGAALRRVALTPPLVAVVAALLINALSVPVPIGLLDGLRLGGQLITLLVVFAMGVLFEPRNLLARPVIAAVLLRCGAGLLLGSGLAIALGLAPSLTAIAAIGGAAPVGFSAVVMADREGLDLGIAVGAASLSAVVGVLLLPTLLLAWHP